MPSDKPMRYTNADHVDYSGLHERRAQLGQVFAGLGALMIVLSICGPAYLSAQWCLGITFLLWLAAWYCIIGVFYRLPLSAAILLQLVIITCQQLGWL